VTYVGTWQDFTYVAFVTDAFSRCPIGWNVVATLKSDIRPLRTLDVAAFDAGGDLIGLTYHFDHGSNYKALVYTDRIAQLGTMPFTGAVGASYDAMAEAIDALYKTELIRARGPWRTVEQVKLATLE
jgi:transposase InsO family protein